MNSDSTQFDSVLDEKATEWLFERAEGFAPGRAEAFIEWCNRDPRHAEAICRVEQALELLDEMPLVRGRIEQRFGRFRAEPVPAPKPLSRAIAYWAGGLAAALVLGAMIWRFSSGTPVREAYASTAAGPQRLALSDGSVIDLNANSNIQVEFSKAERRVTLTTGEAFFRVAHDTGRPFIVVAYKVAVRAVGTAFDVRLAPDKVDVLVTEGRVRIDQVAATSHAEPIIPVLSVGERTQIASRLDAEPRIEKINSAATHALLWWQDGMTGFTNVPLREMINRLNRCNTTKLVLADPTLGDRRIGGVIDLSQVDAFVSMLERDGDILAERRSDGEVVLRRAR